MVFGRTVPDLSLNAIANLGYADVRFRKPVFEGDTVSASSQIVGLRKTQTVKLELFTLSQQEQIKMVK